jgi:tryptophan synthase beta subunit
MYGGAQIKLKREEQAQLHTGAHTFNKALVKKNEA